MGETKEKCLHGRKHTAAGTSKGLDYMLHSVLNILLTILGKEPVHKILLVISGM